MDSKTDKEQLSVVRGSKDEVFWKPDKEQLGIVIGSKDEVFWNSVKEKCVEHILECEREIIIQKHILALAVSKIDEEKEKFK